MRAITTAVLFAGGVVLSIGIVGTFARISNGDGALAVAGAVLVAAAMISRAITDHKAG